MEIQVKMISKTIIRPSSPTPKHLRHFELSSVDQAMVPIFMPLLLFYPGNAYSNNLERCERVKKSLSETLTTFYPLAGRLRENSYVDCNDEGVQFLEAKAKCTILDVLQNPYANHLNKFLPVQVVESNNDMLAFVQVTYFECGGMGITYSMSHKIGDALSSFIFINCWTAIARGEANAIQPQLVSSIYFPPIDISDGEAKVEALKEKIVARRFLFSPSSVAAIREKYISSNGQTRGPTRIEALTAFFWSKFYKTTQINGTVNKNYVMHHPMNLRSRMDPPLSEQCFGNICVEYAVAKADMEAKDGCYGIISQMRDVIRKVDRECVKNLQRGYPFVKLAKEKTERVRREDTIAFDFNSCCGFPMYESDFGWGKPLWVGTVCWPWKNKVIFMDSKEGGIEVYVHLSEDDMVKFERDDELISLSSAFNLAGCIINGV